MSTHISPPIIGIDLGTSTSAIALLKGGRPELLPDDQGDRIIPSVVQLGPYGQILLGSVAKQGSVAFCDRTVQEVKRLMGTDAVIRLAEWTLTPEEVSSLLLRHLKATAEARLGPGAMQDAVISVPARFENAAREATKRAAELAGINVLRLINEPTAAALCYGLDRLAEEQRVLVFDFGGGTLDVTVLEMFEGVLDVKTSVGDDRLGGKDVDELLVRFFRAKFREQRGSDLPPPEQNGRTAQTLKEAAEGCKKQLSVADSVVVEIPYLAPEGGILRFPFSRGELEGLLQGLLDRAMRLVDEALYRAGLTFADIDVILPVGGSSRLPLFRRALERRWGKPIREYDNPDEAVAKGAAVAAGIERRLFDDENGIMILDVSPHRLGVSTMKQVGEGQYIDGYFSEIIPKDAKLPAIERRRYDTLYNGWDTIVIRIYEATTNGNLCQDHRLISELPLENIPEASSGEPVEVEFRYTLDGTLEVSAHCAAAPEVKTGGRYSIARGPEKAAGYPQGGWPEEAKGDFDGIWQSSEDVKRCAPLLDQADKILRQQPHAAPGLRKAVNSLRAALASGHKDDIEQHLDALTDLLFELS